MSVIRSHDPTDDYRQGWDRVFGKEKTPAPPWRRYQQPEQPIKTCDVPGCADVVAWAKDYQDDGYNFLCAQHIQGRDA